MVSLERHTHHHDCCYSTLGERTLPYHLLSPLLELLSFSQSKKQQKGAESVTSTQTGLRVGYPTISASRATRSSDTLPCLRFWRNRGLDLCGKDHNFSEHGSPATGSSTTSTFHHSETISVMPQVVAVVATSTTKPTLIRIIHTSFQGKSAGDFVPKKHKCSHSNVFMIVKQLHTPRHSKMLPGLRTQHPSSPQRQPAPIITAVLPGDSA